MHTAAKYALVQIPSALLLLGVLLLLRRWLDLPLWLIWTLLGLWLLKDALLFPVVRHAYEPGETGTVGSLLGAGGTARERLAPGGYIEVRGELWRAEVLDGGVVETGEKVRVRGATGLTLLVEPLQADPLQRDGLRPE